MGLQTSVPILLPEVNVPKIIGEYKRLRETRFPLNQTLVARLPEGALQEGGQRLGLLQGNTFVFDSEDESAILMDYCIYEVRRNGRNTVEQYIVDCPPPPGSDLATCLHAMKHAKHALVVVLSVQRGVGCLIENLYTDKQHVLIDMGFSQTAKPGLLLATRLLDFGQYCSTAGAAIPLGVLTEDQLADWRQRLQGGEAGENADPAPLIREALQRGSSSRIRYADPDDSSLSHIETSTIPRHDPAARERALSKFIASKSAMTKRCPCGSGKMYKNCCMKRRK